MWAEPFQMAEVTQEGLVAGFEGSGGVPLARLATEIQNGHLRPEYQAELAMPATT